MPNFNAIIGTLLKMNPQVANNPRAMEMLNVIQSGDTQKGERIANNLCQTYGISKEDATKQAENFFLKGFPNMFGR